jgi:hypothetical protein
MFGANDSRLIRIEILPAQGINPTFSEFWIFWKSANIKNALCSITEANVIMSFKAYEISLFKLSLFPCYIMVLLITISSGISIIA